MSLVALAWHRRRVPGSTSLASRRREELRYPECKSHIASYFELTTEKGALCIKFSFYQRNPVFIADGEGDVGLLNSMWYKFANPVDDFESSNSSLLSSNVPLERFSHTCCGSGIEIFGHCIEDFCNGCHSYLLFQFTQERPLLALLKYSTSLPTKPVLYICRNLER